MQRNEDLLRECHDTWLAGALFRHRRRRFKDFAYGRQWADTFRTPEGRVLSEREVFEESGRSPVTNNLIRQTIKSVIGRYRRLMAGAGAPADEAHRAIGSAAEGGEALGRDCRALEEFLISGCAVQRVGTAGVVNVSPERFFFHRFLSTDASDCRLMGMLHDLPLSRVLRMFGADSASCAEIMQLYSNALGQVGAISADGGGVGFHEPELPDHVRVVEVWKRTTGLYTWLHDRSECRCAVFASEDEARRRAAALADGGDEGDPGGRFSCTTGTADYWVQTFLTPGGVVLGSKIHTGADTPFAVTFYPMIDGEVHSFVEDVIDQQKYINRLVTLLDDIIASSAKGVLLFPADQLPDGFTWREVRRLWANPNGVLPYKRTRGETAPRQISTGGTSAGASEMLRLQLQLFDEISGTSSAMRGSAGGLRGVEMLKAETESATTCVLDLLGAFASFTSRRDALLRRLTAREHIINSGGDATPSTSD